MDLEPTVDPIKAIRRKKEFGIVKIVKFCFQFGRMKVGKNLSPSFIKNTSYMRKLKSGRVYDNNWPNLPSIIHFF